MTNFIQLIRDFRKWIIAKYRTRLASGEKDEQRHIFNHHLETININKANDPASADMRLLYFHAKWCGPCKELNSKFMEKTKAIGDIKVERFDYDKDKERPFFDKFDVHSIPTIVLADNNNKILWKHSGSDIALEQIEEKIQKHKIKSKQ